MTAEEVKTELKKISSPERVVVMQQFFKTGKGQYGEGDLFIGASMPDTRKIARQFASLPLAETQKLLDSPVHEERMTAVVILANRYPKVSQEEQQKIYNFYLKNVYGGRINNWDLVDVTTPNVIGEHLVDRPRDILFKLARSSDVWQKRVSVMATYAFIKRSDGSTTLEIAKILLADKHDLIHKAVGWMLREAGKRVDEKILTDFLDKHAHEMPRTMLRYAIEKLSPSQKLHYMKLKSV